MHKARFHVVTVHHHLDRICRSRGARLAVDLRRLRLAMWRGAGAPVPRERSPRGRGSGAATGATSAEEVSRTPAGTRPEMEEFDLLATFTSDASLQAIVEDLAD